MVDFNYLEIGSEVYHSRKEYKGMSFVDGYIAELGTHFSAEDTRYIRDTLYAFTLNFEVRPLQTALAVTEYELPMEYKMFMVAKRQDGRMSDRSAKQYKLCLETFLMTVKLPVQSITTQHIRAYLFQTDNSKFGGKPISPYTRNARKSMLRSFFEWLCQNGYIDKNPTEVIKMERTDGVEPRNPITDEEIELLRLNITTVRERAIIEMFLATGVRASELIGMKKSDVNFKERSVHVLGKGNKWRTVYYNKATAVHLKRYLDSRNDESPYLFVCSRAPHGGLSSSRIISLIVSCGKLSGVKHLHPHRLRHTFASRLEKSGCPIEVIQELLGHTRLDTTRRYVKVDTRVVQANYERYMS